MRNEEKDNSGTGYEEGSTLLFSTTARFCNIKQTKKLLFSFDYDRSHVINGSSDFIGGLSPIWTFLSETRGPIKIMDDLITTQEVRNIRI